MYREEVRIFLKKSGHNLECGIICYIQTNFERSFRPICFLLQSKRGDEGRLRVESCRNRKRWVQATEESGNQQEFAKMDIRWQLAQQPSHWCNIFRRCQSADLFGLGRTGARQWFNYLPLQA